MPRWPRVIIRRRHETRSFRGRCPLSLPRRASLARPRRRLPRRPRLPPRAPPRPWPGLHVRHGGHAGSTGSASRSRPTAASGSWRPPSTAFRCSAARPSPPGSCGRTTSGAPIRSISCSKATSSGSSRAARARSRPAPRPWPARHDHGRPDRSGWSPARFPAGFYKDPDGQLLDPDQRKLASRSTWRRSRSSTIARWPRSPSPTWSWRPTALSG